MKNISLFQYIYIRKKNKKIIYSLFKIYLNINILFLNFYEIDNM